MSGPGDDSPKRGLWAALTRTRRGAEADVAVPEAPPATPEATPLFKTIFGAMPAAPAAPEPVVPVNLAPQAPSPALEPEPETKAAVPATVATEVQSPPVPAAPPPPPAEDDFVRLARLPTLAPARAERPARPRPAPSPIEPRHGEIRRPAEGVPTQRVSPAEYLAPRDLEQTDTGPVRILAIGSCFLQSQVGPWGHDRKTRVEFVLATNANQFPAAPPSPISEYDCQIIQIPLRLVMYDTAFLHLDYADKAAYEARFEKSCAELKVMLAQRMQWNVEHGIRTFVLNFLVPQFPSMGRFFPRYDLRNVEYFVERLNQELEVLAGTYRATHVLDVDRIAASLGRRYIQDDIYTVFGHGSAIGSGVTVGERMEPVGVFGDYYETAPGVEFGRAILSEIRAMHRTLLQVDSIKLIVVDLDDTLWKGVSGDSADIGPHMVEGWPIGLVEALHYARKRGILLAIISKNDEARIRAIWTEIFPRRLRLEDFCAVRINWRPKAENMAEILQAINLLPRNVLFIDDNPAERAQMQAAFDGMRTLGANPFHFRRILLLAPEAQPVSVTEESAQRTAMVQSQLNREADRAALSTADFASQQGVKLRLLRVTDTTHRRFARALELINKTNQFNTTGRRWTEQECDGFFAAGGSMFSYEVEDRYTSYGLVGVVLLHGRTIVQWVMSCRVIGLRVEHAAMREIVMDIRRDKALPITAKLTKTDTNRPCHELFSAAGFTQQGESWVLEAADVPPRVETVAIMS